MSPLETSWNGSNKLCSKWSPTVWTSSYRSSSEASIRAHCSLSISRRSCQKWWTTCSDGQISTPCSKTTSGRLLNKSESPIVRPGTTMQETLSPQTNQGKITRGGMASSSQMKLVWPPSTSHTKKILPMIHNLSNFKCPELIKTNLTKRDLRKWCAYHKDRGHTTKQCRNLHYLVEILIRVRHLKQYVRINGKQRETTRDLAFQALMASTAPKVVINYIHGGPADDRYNFKWKMKRFLCAASIKEWISFV